MQIDPSTLILTIINFLILMVILDRLLFRPILKHMGERQLRVQAGLKAGDESAKQLAQARLGLEEEDKALRAALQQQAEDRLNQLSAQARLRHEQAEADIRRKRDDALIALREEQLELTHALSQELPQVIDQLKDRVDPASGTGA